MPERYCANCGSVAEPQRFVPGSFVVEVILWICGLLPGVIYSSLRRTKGYYGCPRCKAPNMLPLDSPKALELPAVRGFVEERAGAGVPSWFSERAFLWSILGGLLILMAIVPVLGERACSRQPAIESQQNTEEQKKQEAEAAIFNSMTPAQHLERAKLALRPGATG